MARGGYAAAFRAAELGLNVVLIEKDKVGGTCLHRGCIPTKALLHAGEVADLAREGEQFGVKTSLAGIDMDGVNAYKDGVIAKLYKGLQGLVKARKITYVEGEGRLDLPDHGRGGRPDATRASTSCWPPAPTPASLPGLEIDGTKVITSDHALNLDRVPASAIILGGGVIGCEFASAWKSFGVDVTIVEALPHLVPLEDESSLQAAGARVPPPQDRLRAGQPVLRRRAHRERREGLAGERQGDRGRAAARRRRPRPGRARASATRRPASQMDRGFVLVDEYCQTNVPTISAVGDLIPTLQLAHVGFGEGILVAERVAGLQVVPIDYAGVPRITYSDPEVASVGLTEAQAKEQLRRGQDRSPTTSPATASSQILKTAGAVKLIQAQGRPGRRRPHGRQPGRRAHRRGAADLQLGGRCPTRSRSSSTRTRRRPRPLGEAHLALAGKPLHAHG